MSQTFTTTLICFSKTLMTEVALSTLTWSPVRELGVSWDPAGLWAERVTLLTSGQLETDTRTIIVFMFIKLHAKKRSIVNLNSVPIAYLYCLFILRNHFYLF